MRDSHCRVVVLRLFQRLPLDNKMVTTAYRQQTVLDEFSELLKAAIVCRLDRQREGVRAGFQDAPARAERDDAVNVGALDSFHRRRIVTVAAMR